MTILIDSDKLYRICDYLESNNEHNDDIEYYPELRYAYKKAISDFREQIRREIFIGGKTQ